MNTVFMLALAALVGLAFVAVPAAASPQPCAGFGYSGGQTRVSQQGGVYAEVAVPNGGPYVYAGYSEYCY